uniref:FHOD1 N-terminal GTPase-binding domain-containing protein n=1 Tax=Romanomermis culicivorax TaxID=13658 RepID=A0A915KKN0_ROMCU
MSKNVVLNVKVQYINDIDPFSTSLAYLEPSRPFTHSFELHVPLGDQIPYVHKLLRAPHKVEECTMQIYRPRTDQFVQVRLDPAPSSALGLRQENTDYFGAYLDWDMSLAEQ